MNPVHDNFVVKRIFTLLNPPNTIKIGHMNGSLSRRDFPKLSGAGLPGLLLAEFRLDTVLAGQGHNRPDR